jgi:lysophospholipase L1-like esterase
MIKIPLKTWLFIFCTCVCQFVCQGQTDLNLQSLDSLPYIKEKFNIIQFFNSSALSSFYHSWQSSSNKIVIATLGDSHLQSEIYPNAFRKALQNIKGNGGKGLIFNYSAADTYGSEVYKSTFTGKWENAKSRFNNPKLPIGFSGMTLRTTESKATLSFNFKGEFQPKPYLIKLFVKSGNQSFNCKLYSGENSKEIDLFRFDTSKPYIEFVMNLDKEIHISLLKQKSTQNSFEFYGLSIENIPDSGVLVHNAGVGAAQYRSILNESLFENQIKVLNPSLVVLDFGTNDFLYYDTIESSLETTIKKVIATVKKALPNASIILNTQMDMQFRGKTLRSEAAFGNLIFKIAKEENTAVYDWYQVAGGNDVISLFLEDNLVRPDKIHLTTKGYRLKGDLFALALLKSISYLNKSKTEPLLINVE